MGCVARDFLQPAAFSTDDTADGFLGPDREGPRMFGNFELMGELGRGGSGVVYRARQVALGREVAIKFLLDGAFAGEESIARFKAEAAAAAELRHPHIVTIHEVGQVEGHHYFSMELVQGQTLAAVVRDGPLPAMRAAAYVQRIAEAVGFAHCRGVLHRDLKPSNILLDEQDQPRVSDFGLAKRTGDPAGLTGTGQVLGTPAYMSPEQAQGGQKRPVDERSDIYSLGAILYHLLSGRAPFTGDSPTAVLRQVCESEPVGPRLLNPSVPRDLETICLQSLSKDPARRYPTAGAMAEDLGRFIRGECVLARRQGWLEKGVRWCRRRPALALALGGIGVLMGAVVLISVQSARRVERLRLGSLTNLYASDLRLAQHVIQNHRFGSAKALLDRHCPIAGDPDLRGFEWRHLHAVCASQEAATLGTHGAQVQRMALSPDGRWVATVSTDLRVWDVATRQMVLSKPLGEYGWALGFSPDSREVLVVDAVGTGSRFAVGSGAALGRFQLDGKRAMAVAWAPSAKGPGLLAAGGLIGLDLSTGEGRPMGGLPTTLSRAFVTADAGQAALILGRAETAVWDLERSVEVARFQLPRPARAVVWLPAQQRLVAGDLTGALHVWNRDGREPFRSFPAHRGMVECLAISPDGTRLASAGADQLIRLWNTATWQPAGRLQGHEAFVFGLCFGKDGKTLYSGDRLGTVKEWKVDDAEGEPALSFGASGFLSMDGRRLLRLDPGDRLSVCDPVQPKRVLADVPWNSGWIPVPSAVGILARAADGGLRRYATNGVWTAVGSLRIGSPGVTAASADGRFVCHRPDGTASCSVIEVEGGREVIRFDDDPSWLAPTFSADGGTFCVGSSGGRVRVHDLPSGRLRGTIPAHHGYAYACDLSRDGTRLATAGFDGVVRLWSTETMAMQGEFRSAMESFWSVALSPDGRRIAAGTGESSVVVWDVPSGLEVATLGMGEPLFPVEGLLRFTPDGSTLVLGGARWRTWHGAQGE